jgi:hypothetical protein
VSPRRRALPALFLLLAACRAAAPPPPAPVVTPSPVAAPSLPQTAAEATAARQRGQTWSNVEVREHYLRLVGTIPERVRQLAAAGRSLEEQARAAYQIRHDARQTTRAMMTDAREVEGLRERDRQKYGTPDGPTFESLLETQRKRGLTDDAAYQAIVESAQRTNSAADAILKK